MAVVIVGFRNADDVHRCVEALCRSTYRDFEVVVQENGGPEAYAALLQVMPRELPGKGPVRVVQSPGNIGFAAGVNAGMRISAESDAWWVLNPDTLPHEDALERMVERLSSGDCDAVGCTLYRPNGTIQSHGCLWRGWLARPVSIGNGDKVGSEADAQFIERWQDYLNGASMLIGRRFLEMVGPMREDYFLYCEEAEWCLRGLVKGARLGYAPAALVQHAQGATTGAGEEVIRQPRLPVYLIERNRILLTRDCFPLRLPIAAAAGFAQLLLRYGRRRAWRQLAHGLQGWAAGLRNERGPPSFA